jgi:acetylornithine deacetylase/succinyl-diaminopimelate desuccinylase-like protein
MSDHRTKALEYAGAHKEYFLNSLKEILAIPSISTDPKHVDDMLSAAEWIAGQLKILDMENVTIFPTGRYPIVYGDKTVAKGLPTVLIYGHYDVQPVDPLELWLSQPFEAAIRGENLYARGASDMKGQVVAVHNALESILRTGALLINLKWIIEGEEEIGSPNLEAFIASHKELLSCDFALNTDSGMLGADAPSITYALRGLAFFELKVTGPATDLHSGIYGGVVHNPANALAELIAGMHDKQGRVTLPGFYDRVLPLNDEDRAEMARLPLSDLHYIHQTGVPALAGEAGYTSVERASSRPTLDVNGMQAGFTGVGSKTVIPSWAMAKLSMRLVPDQDPREVHQQLIEYLENNASHDIRWELTAMAGGRASISHRDTPGVLALMKALESEWGIRPYFKREGGSVPVVNQMQEILGIDSVLTGFGLPDDNLHAPNEKIHLPTWYKGINALIHFFLNLAE